MEQKTLFEKIGVQYEERDGLFYPLITLDIKDDGVNVGKYGHMWMQYLKSESATIRGTEPKGSRGK